jgi:hypothetical protein
MLLVALAACEPTTVELFADARGGSGLDARSPLDAEPGADAAQDASAPDVAVLDADAPDAAPADAAAPDASAPDATVAACVCRYTPCRLSSDCVAQLGAGSTCGGDFYCTGSVGTCQTADECRPGFVCVVDARSTTRCP